MDCNEQSVLQPAFQTVLMRAHFFQFVTNKQGSTLTLLIISCIFKIIRLSKSMKKCN